MARGANPSPGSKSRSGVKAGAAGKSRADAKPASAGKTRAHADQTPDERYPALALLEFSGVASGVHAADAMVKKSPIALLKIGTVHPGHYLTLIGGSVASVEEAWREGLRIGADHLVDEIFLPDVHSQVHDTALGALRSPRAEALGVLEARHTASLLGAADAAVKACEVELTQLRLADDLGGRAFVFLDGRLADVEAALEVGAARLGDTLLDRSLLPRLDENLRALLADGSRYGACDLFTPAGAEPPRGADPKIPLPLRGED